MVEFAASLTPLGWITLIVTVLALWNLPKMMQGKGRLLKPPKNAPEDEPVHDNTYPPDDR